MSSSWQDWKSKNAHKQFTGRVSPLDFLNPETQYASTEEADRRYSICQECPQLTLTKQCKECGCFMAAKVKLDYATCPLKKW